jgi:hypothetical protein
MQFLLYLFVELESISTSDRLTLYIRGSKTAFIAANFLKKLLSFTSYSHLNREALASVLMNSFPYETTGSTSVLSRIMQPFSSR